MRRITAILLGIALVASSIFLAKNLIANKKKPKPRFNKIVKTVFTETVHNKTIPIAISSHGNLVAKNKIDLFAEVQGVLKTTAKEFKTGTAFNRGDVLVSINSDEFSANLQAQKSNLYNALTAIMPDIQLDFQKEYPKWKLYLQNFDKHQFVGELPKTNSEKEKFFISGRGITSKYYAIKNLEVKLAKHTLKAPFSGILTETFVNPGTLIRPGQKLGEFISPEVYELQVSVKSAFQNLLKIGKKVNLSNLENTQNYTGKVLRINGKVDVNTQTIKAFIQVSDPQLKEGQYMAVSLQGKAKSNVYEVSRKLLIDAHKLYVVNNNKLEFATVTPVFENKNTVIVKGLLNGVQLVSKPIPGAYVGMQVKIYTANKH